MSVTNFYQSVDYYLDLFDEKCDKGNYPDGFAALSYAERVANKADMSDIYLAKAQGYAEIDRLRSSNKFYFKTLKSGSNRQEALFGLFQNMMLIGRRSDAMYYSSLLEDCAGEIDTETVMDALSGSLQEAEQSQYGVAYEKESYDVKLAAECIRDTRFDDAIEILERIPTENKHFVKAMNDLCLCYTVKRDYEGALSACMRALEKDAEDVPSLCNELMLERLLKKNSNEEEILEKLLSVKPDDQYDIAKIATTMCDMNRHEDARRYLELAVKATPYVEIYELLLGIAQYNLQDFAASKKTFSDLLKLDRDDTVAKYYLRLVNVAEERFKKGGQVELLDYIPQMPYADIMKLYRRLDDFLCSLDVDEFISDGEVSDCFEFALESGDLDTIEKVVRKILAADPPWKEEILDDLLLDSSVSEDIKQEIIEDYLIEKKRSIELTVGLRYDESTVTYPKNFSSMDSTFKTAFAMIGALYSVTKSVHLFKELAKATNKVYELCTEKECDFKSFASLAVVIAMVEDDSNNERELCEMLGGTPATVKKYREKLGL